MIGTSLRTPRLVALAATLALSLGISPAIAAEGLPAEGLVELLATGDVIGDGETPATLHVLALGPDGTPLTGLRLRAVSDEGDAGDVTELGDGLYAFDFVAPEVEDTRPVRVEVKGRTAELGAFSADQELVVRAVRSAPIDVIANPEQMVLGQDDSATISFRLPKVAGDAAAADDLLVRVSSGEVGSIVAMGDGRFTARYTPPPVNYPHLAMLTVADRRDPTRRYGHAVIPLQGKVGYPVQTEAGASVVLVVGDREFGPVQTDASGRAAVPIVVPPGVSTATMKSVVDGQVTTTSLDLRVPEVRRIQFVPVQVGIPSESRREVPVRLLVVSETGEPDDGANISLSATAGRFGAPRSLGGGVYEAIYTPPDGRTQMAATLQATVPGGAIQSDGAEVSLIPPMPAQVDLTAEPERLAPSGTGLQALAHLEAADGTGLNGRDVRFRANGATREGEVEALGGGDYRADFTADGGTDVALRVEAASMPSGNALANLVVIPDRAYLPADGVTTTPITIATADLFGYPVPGVPISLSVLEGGGQLPSSATSDDAGVAEVWYTPGTEGGAVVIEARAEGYVGRTTLIVGHPDAGPDLPASGEAVDRDIHGMWAGSRASLTVPRGDGITAAPAAAAPDTDPVAVTALDVTLEPDTAAPGGAVVVRVEARDASGQGVGGADLDFFATAGGRFGPTVEEGAGRYRTELMVPDDAVGSLKVSVVGGGGAVTRVVEIPIVSTGTAASDDPWAAGPATAAPEPTDEPASTVVVTENPAGPPEEAKAPYDRPFFRARVSALVSSYAYGQRPGDRPGDLLPTELSWGGDSGGAAVPVGLEAHVRAHVPSVPYVAFQAQYRFSRYSVSGAAFSEPARDNLHQLRADVIGRVPIAIDRDEISIGARVGFRYDDVITFRGCSELGCNVGYESIGLPGLGTALELGTEFWHMYAMVAGGAGFAYGSQPYAYFVDANLGWNITKHVFIDAGFGWQLRQAALEGADSGETRGDVEDLQLIGTLGVGASF